MCWYIYKKARESVPVTRSAIRGLRIAHLAKTSNTEAHADMYIYSMPPHLKHTDKGMGLYKTYPQGIYRCLVFSKIRVCEVPNRQEQSVK